MKVPPREIDGATVVQFADVSDTAQTGRTQHTVRGSPIEKPFGLAIAKYDSDPGIYLFYCDEDWRAITDTYHETVEAAMEQARFEFLQVDFLNFDNGKLGG